VCFAVLLPQGRFLQPQDRRFAAHRSLYFFSPTGPFARTGLSLTRSDCPSQDIRFGVDVSDLVLRSYACCLPRPFALPLHLRHRFAPVTDGFSASGPLRLQLPAPQTSSTTCAPLSGFCPVRIEAFGCFSRLSNRLASPPDFLSLPAAIVSFKRLLPRIIVPGPLRSRWLAVPQTSWNLLQYD
jgi:hypothetical protein